MKQYLQFPSLKINYGNQLLRVISFKKNQSQQTDFEGENIVSDTIDQKYQEKNASIDENELTDDEVLFSYINSSQKFETDEVDRLIILDHLEKKFFKNVSNKVEGYYVPVGKEVNIWTVKVSPKNEEDITQAPVLFIHGLCAGIAHWIKIMDISSSNQVCYFIDLPGFGKSSRPDFSKSFDVVETVIIQFIENWRIHHKIETAMKLVGHSFGGYISFLYASKLPKNVSSLILLDPWGVYSPNLDLFHSSKCQNDISLKMRMIRAMTRFISPFSIMRKTGMFGKFLLRNIRNELYIPYKDLVSQDTFFDYIFYSNIGLPTGEKSYKVLQDNVINSKFPLIERTDCFPDMKHIKITLCIGTKSVLYKAYQNQNQQLCDAFGENNFRYIEFSDVDHHIHSSDVFIKSFADYLSENV